ncbi:MAG: glycoside hydrolase family 10 protein [Longibaculum sp.]
MKKKRHSFVVITILICISLIVYFFFPRPTCSLSSFDKRAVWFSYSDLAKFSYVSKKEFRDDFKEALNVVEKYKNNTIIVQVRPFADALYQSKIFPISQIITQRSSLSFDPLLEMIDIAHQKGLSIEAWINPYRISLNQKTYQQFLTNSSKSSWLEDTKQTIAYATYKYILNPASQDVRDYVVAGVKEIVENYDIDGIHFDDYFYVEGTHTGTTQNQRMDYVNMLISDVYQSIKAIKPNVVFGISPQGNYENCINEGADVDTWLKEEGYIDYLMPQIYWSDQYGSDGKTSMFTNRVKTFAGLKKQRSIMLYAGLALYQSGEKRDMDKGWIESSSNISKQVQILYEYGFKGYSLFAYESLLKDEGKKEMDNLIKDHPYQ